MTKCLSQHVSHLSVSQWVSPLIHSPSILHLSPSLLPNFFSLIHLYTPFEIESTNFSVSVKVCACLFTFLSFLYSSLDMLLCKIDVFKCFSGMTLFIEMHKIILTAWMNALPAMMLMRPGTIHCQQNQRKHNHSKGRRLEHDYFFFSMILLILIR